MDSKTFFKEVRKIIREEIQRALDGRLVESKKISTSVKKVIKQEVPELNDGETKSLKQMLTETAEEMQHRVTDGDTLHFTAADAEAFGYGEFTKGKQNKVSAVDINGRRVPIESLDQNVVSALTKDYSKLIKKMEEKKKK